MYRSRISVLVQGSWYRWCFTGDAGSSCGVPGGRIGDCGTERKCDM